MSVLAGAIHGRPPGPVARLRPRGVGRYASALFLSVWLCGWAAGEAFALWFLFRAFLAIVMGRPMGTPEQAPGAGMAAFGVGFVMVWLAFWTLGGVLAIRELLSMLWGEDRMYVTAGDLVREARRWPFRSRQAYPRAAIERIRVLPGSHALVVDLADATRELSRLGSVADREAAAKALRHELCLEERPVDTDALTLPAEWRVVSTPEGSRALVQDPVMRAKQARVLMAVTAVAAGGTLWLVSSAVHNLKLIPLALMATAATGGLVWGALWLAYGRMEWRIGSGRIVLQRRLRGRVRPVFEGRSIELTISSDSDGDEWIAAEAVGGEVARPSRTAPTGSVPGVPVGPLTTEAVATRSGAWQTRRGLGSPAAKNRRRICHLLNDDREPRQVALYLARAADIPFVDRTTRAARSADLGEMLERLEGTGPTGRKVAGVLRRWGRK